MTWLMSISVLFSTHWNRSHHLISIQNSNPMCSIHNSGVQFLFLSFRYFLSLSLCPSLSLISFSCHSFRFSWRDKCCRIINNDGTTTIANANKVACSHFNKPIVPMQLFSIFAFHFCWCCLRSIIRTWIFTFHSGKNVNYRMGCVWIVAAGRRIVHRKLT